MKTSGLIMGQICRQFLHAFSVNSGIILKKCFFCRSILCFVSEWCVNDFTEVKELKTVLTGFLYFVSYESNASKFWQLVCKFISIRLISFHDFMKMEGPKTKFMQQLQTMLNVILIEYEISVFRKVRHGLVIFIRTQIKLTLFWRVYILRP